LPNFLHFEKAKDGEIMKDHFIVNAYQRSLGKIAEDGRHGMEGVELTLKIRHGSCNSEQINL